MVNRRGIFAILSIILMLIFCSIVIVYAEEPGTRVKDIDYALNNTKCKIDYYTNVVSLINNVSSQNNFSVSGDLFNGCTKLQDDIFKLNEFSGDREVFRENLILNCNPDLNNTKNLIDNWKNNTYKNLTNDIRKNFKKDYNGLKKTYDKCHIDTLKNYGNGRIVSYKAILDNYQKQADDMQEKGVDTSSLNKILNSAKIEIIDPLHSKLTISTNSKSIRNAIESYCLFDGCSNGTNFHLGAKFAIAKLYLAMDIIKSNSSLSTPEKLSELEGYINTCKTTLSEVETKQYTNEQKRTIWDNIKNANNLIMQIKTIIKTNTGNKK